MILQTFHYKPIHFNFQILFHKLFWVNVLFHSAIENYRKKPKHSRKSQHTRRIMYQDLYSDSDSDDGFVLSSDTSSGMEDKSSVVIPEPHVNIPGKY